MQKRSVGRPKLADNKLIKKSLIFLVFCMVITIALILTAGSELFGYNAYDKLLASAKKDNQPKCPTAPDIKGVKSGSNYKTNQVKITINTSDLTKKQIDKLYVVTKSYNASAKIKNKENIGRWNDEKTTKFTKYFSGKENKYSQTITTNNYYYIAIYAGKKRCYYNYIVKDNYTIVSNYRKYNFRNYNVVTKKGVIRGYATTTSLEFSNNKDNQLMKYNGLSGVGSCLATNQNALSGYEKTNKTKVTFKQGKNEGYFNIKLPSTYYSTGYLKNPLYKYGKGNNKSTSIKTGYKKTDVKEYNMKAKKAEKQYGLEIKSKKGHAVYTMDAGTVYEVKKALKKEKENYITKVVIKSTVNGTEYYHAYANLKSTKLKKGQRVYKGQKIGELGKSKLYVSLVFNNKGKSTGVAINNFIGRNISYANVNKDNYEQYQKYIDDGKLLVNNSYCEFPCKDGTCLTIKLYQNDGKSNSFKSYTAEDVNNSFKDVLGDSLTPEKRKGYNFKGWYTESTGGKKVNETDIIKNVFAKSKTIKLYARWEPKKYTVTFDANGGKFSDGAQKIIFKANYDSYYSFKNVKSLTKEGYIFGGWKNSNTNIITTSSSEIINKDVTYTAVWKDYGADIYFLNTKAGAQSILFKSIDNEFALLDTGEPVSTGKKNEEGKSVKSCRHILNSIYNIVPETQRVHKIKYLFISHWHPDHKGCLADILNNPFISVENIYIKEDIMGKARKEVEEKINNSSTKAKITYGFPETNELTLGEGASAIKIKLFNTENAFKNSKDEDGNSLCFDNNNKNPKRSVVKYGAINYQKKNDSKEVESPESVLSENGKPEVANIYNSKVNTVGTKDNSVNEINKIVENKLKDIPYDNYYAFQSNDKNYRCSENTNSVALLLEIPTKSGKKYAYFPSDLENNGVPFEGKKVTINGETATIYSSGSSYFEKTKDDDSDPNVYVFAEATTALDVRKYICGSNKSCDNLSNIVLYQASHHGYNVDKYSIDILNLNNPNVYVVAPTSTQIGAGYIANLHRTFYSTLAKVKDAYHFTSTASDAILNDSANAVIFRIESNGKVDASSNRFIDSSDDSCTNTYDINTNTYTAECQYVQQKQ